MRKSLHPAQPDSAPAPIDARLRRRMIATLRAHGVRRAGVFGSVARGDARPESDIDLLIEPPRDMSLFGFSALALALEDLLRRPVDLVTYASLHLRLRASVYAHYDELFSDLASDSSSNAEPEPMAH
ncbi:MAG TPA: nucleotidyltransferase domain-containing protein [Ktedonobacterales bacterium]|jgi:predicted nucleotidyltransferase|nr:nucleotidyltransferase domain-containing protein [Ktedonobacterales bacterium]